MTLGPKSSPVHITEGQVLFSTANSTCPMKKDYNTGVPIRRAMFCHLNKPISVQFVKGVCNIPTVAAKRPFETQFFKNNLKTDSVTYLFFFIFENLIKISSLTRGIRKNYLVELDLFIKELFWVEKKNATR